MLLWIVSVAHSRCRLDLVAVRERSRASSGPALSARVAARQEISCQRRKIDRDAAVEVEDDGAEALAAAGLRA
jgi:hypothetical protein